MLHFQHLFIFAISYMEWWPIPWFSNWMNISLNWIKPNLNFWINFWIEFSRKKDHWIIFWIEYSWKNILNNPLNWILPWNEWMNHILSQYLPFSYGKSLLSSILDTLWPIFGHFSCLTSIYDFLTIELNYLMNWISMILF